MLGIEGEAGGDGAFACIGEASESPSDSEESGGRLLALPPSMTSN